MDKDWFHEVSSSKQQMKKASMNCKGTWHIYEMDMWDEDYFNMEVQAYVSIESDTEGRFQFGLVSGYMRGQVVQEETGEKFVFTWDGNDECDPASGRGSLKLQDSDTVEGLIDFDYGDESTFLARRAK